MENLYHVVGMHRPGISRPIYTKLELFDIIYTVRQVRAERKKIMEKAMIEIEMLRDGYSKKYLDTLSNAQLEQEYKEMQYRKERDRVRAQTLFDTSDLDKLF
jgi:hypothetical protein